MVHAVVDLAVLLEQLEALGELPLAGDQAAVAGDPGLAAAVRELVDPVGLRLGGVVLPELDVGVRPVGVLGQLAQRRAVGEHREHRAGGEVGADADDLRRVDAGRPDRGGDGVLQHLDVVVRNLQGPVDRQRDRPPDVAAGPAVSAVSITRVRVLVDGRAELGAVRRPARRRRARTACRSRRRS